MGVRVVDDFLCLGPVRQIHLPDAPRPYLSLDIGDPGAIPDGFLVLEAYGAPRDTHYQMYFVDSDLGVQYCVATTIERRDVPEIKVPWYDWTLGVWVEQNGPNILRSRYNGIIDAVKRFAKSV